MANSEKSYIVYAGKYLSDFSPNMRIDSIGVALATAPVHLPAYFQSKFILYSSKFYSSRASLYYKAIISILPDQVDGSAPKQTPI